MLAFALRRVVNAVLVLLALSVLVFSILQFVPGDPAVTVAGMGASEADIAAIRAQLGLDQPLYVQFLTWFWGILHGDWGVSIVSKEPVLPILMDRFAMTLLLATAGILFAAVVGIALGVNAALRANTGADLVLSVIALLGVSAPIFWIGLLLQLLFSIKLGLLPATGAGNLWHLVLPAIAIGGNSVGIIMRMTRSSLLEVLKQDFVRTARAKGLPRHTIVYKHALRNAFIPVLTVIGVQFAYLMGGAVLIETVFVWPGIGKLLADSVFRRDFPMVQGAILTIGFFFVLVNTLVDLAYSFVDPRIRLS
ncbi:peptide ABC transporter permease [Acuticoccus sediminis]|uniref:Peptide ABC transporter permease n=1 Tax=Acuticoccus sediminis TaxID=2184697 RepID=A0A8B2NF30_9HYPH|nr:peptide ABC transporter permease [Acuticoccus sediminis]